MSALIDTRAIAERLELTREYVTDKLVKRPDFPKPYLNINRKVRKWLAEDVEMWRKRTARA